MSEEKENNTQQNTKREWWEIPARGSALILLILLFIPDPWYRAAYYNTIGRFFRYTVEERLEDFGERCHRQMKLEKLPEKLKIIVLKEERRLELWGGDSAGQYSLIKTLPVLASSGKAGPKLREGDKQIPEGAYGIESLHPNSRFYLGLRVNYPSEEDKKMALIDGRSLDSLGSDIMIHGLGGSVGCVVVSNTGIEDIFYLTAKLARNKSVIPAPERNILILFVFNFKYVF